MKAKTTVRRSPRTELETRWAEKRRVRESAIERLIEEASDRGDTTHRMYWTLLYDFEHAPLTTNLEQLAEAGVVLPAADDLTDDEVQEWMWELIEGLGELGIYLLHTDHLSDRALYRHMTESVLAEPVRDLPPDAGVHEFIDLVGGAAESQIELYQRHYASEEERLAFFASHGYSVAREPRPYDRDQDLPRPSDHRSRE